MTIFFVVFSLFFAPDTAFGAGFSITPMLQEVSLESDRSAESDVSIRNDTGESATFTVSTIDFKGLDQSGGVAFLGASGAADAYSLADWVEPAVSEVTLSPGESQQIRVRIRNDETLSPGGHYGAIVFRQASQAGPADTPKVALQQLFTSLFFVKKLGGAQYGMKLDSWEGKRLIWQPFSSEKVTFRATGNVHVVPRGEVRVADPLGRLVAKASLNESSSIVLPGTVREFPTPLRPVLTAWIPGKYRLTLQYRSDDSAVPETMERDAYFIPVRFLIIFFSIPTLFLIARRFWRTWRVRSTPKNLL